jgi:hypothetical protein
VVTESRDGHTRDAICHWISGDDPTDGWSARSEVILDEAVELPTVSRCAACRAGGDLPRLGAVAAGGAKHGATSPQISRGFDLSNIDPFDWQESGPGR